MLRCVRLSYLHWLVAISLLFVVLERLLPWRRGQALLRPGWPRDLGFLAINGHLFALLYRLYGGGHVVGGVHDERASGRHGALPTEVMSDE